MRRESWLSGFCIRNISSAGEHETRIALTYLKGATVQGDHIPVTEKLPGDVILTAQEAQRLKNTLMVARDYLEGESFTKQVDQVQIWIELLEGKMEAKTASPSAS